MLPRHAMGPGTQNLQKSCAEDGESWMLPVQLSVAILVLNWGQSLEVAQADRVSLPYNATLSGGRMPLPVPLDQQTASLH